MVTSLSLMTKRMVMAVWLTVQRMEALKCRLQTEAMRCRFLCLSGFMIKMLRCSARNVLQDVILRTADGTVEIKSHTAMFARKESS